MLNNLFLRKLKFKQPSIYYNSNTLYNAVPGDYHIPLTDMSNDY